MLLTSCLLFCVQRLCWQLEGFGDFLYLVEKTTCPFASETKENLWYLLCQLLPFLFATVRIASFLFFYSISSQSKTKEPFKRGRRGCATQPPFFFNLFFFAVPCLVFYKQNTGAKPATIFFTPFSLLPSFQLIYFLICCPLHDAYHRTNFGFLWYDNKRNLENSRISSTSFKRVVHQFRFFLDGLPNMANDPHWRLENWKSKIFWKHLVGAACWNMIMP